MIKRIKWKNYQALGNLELDFCKADGTPYSTIILAGDNGTGKTTILDTLSTFLSLHSMLPFDFIEYGIGSETYRITPDERNGNIGFHHRIKLSDGKSKEVSTNRDNRFEQLQSDTEDIRYYGVAYSKARTGFKTKKIQSSTTEQMDREKYENDSTDDYSRIKQLLVDLSGQDNSDLMSLCESENGMAEGRFQQFKQTSRMYRFSKAFDDFFDGLKYDKIDESNPDEKKISFIKHGKRIAIDSLSTGEQQIVFRGTHLLRNSKTIAGGVVLIDEPELSMHPKWQKKILKYYRDLFTNNGQQTVQMILATHSSYVIQKAMEDKDNVLVIVLNDNNGTVQMEKVTTPHVLPSITAAETNYLAFHVPSKDYHIELYGWLQNKYGLNTVSACDQYIAAQPQYDPQKHAKASVHGSTQYQTLPTYIRNAIDHPDPVNRPYTDEQVEESIKLLIELCR